MDKSWFERLIRRSLKALLLLLRSAGVRASIGGAKYRIAGFYLNRLRIDERFESWMSTAYKAALRTEDGAFIDIGVNAGQTLTKVLSIDKNRQYVGFEPQLDCCFYVNSFIRKNCLKNHILLPVGLSDRTAIMRLFKRHENVDAGASTIEGFRPADFYTDSQTIYVVKGDDIIRSLELHKVAVIKIDVEGGELEVLRGLTQTLRIFRPYVFFEVLNHYLVMTDQQLDPKTIQYREQRLLQLEKVLRVQGFRIYNVLPGNKLVEVEIIKPVVSKDLRITNYVAVHDSKVNAFLSSFDVVIGRGRS